ncbi:hypothetical protein [Methylovirgula sp. 4M-Z18]|nr:hypothetical protein [Methylovirgula sp. 4M-Z18]
MCDAADGFASVAAHRWLANIEPDPADLLRPYLTKPSSVLLRIGANDVRV